MNKAQLKKIKKNLIEQIFEYSEPSTLTDGLQTKPKNLFDQKANRRISLGQSVDADGDYTLELRVHKKRGLAYTNALKIKEAYKDVNIEVYDHVNVPSVGLNDDSVQLQQFKRPIFPGFSISTLDDGAGTIAGFVENKDGTHLLSCNHVIAKLGEVDMKSKVQRQIYQPAVQDHPNFDNDNIVAELSKYAPIAQTAPNEIDAAIAILNDENQLGGNVVPNGFTFGGREIEPLPKGYEIPKGTIVYKIGRTTGLTSGELSGLSFDLVTVSIGKKPYNFNNVIEISWLESSKPFSKQGDSGSIAFIEDNDKLYAIGMVFAAGRKKIGKDYVGITLLCTLKDILRRLKVTWV